MVPLIETEISEGKAIFMRTLDSLLKDTDTVHIEHVPYDAVGDFSKGFECVQLFAHYKCMPRGYIVTVAAREKVLAKHLKINRKVKV